MPFASKAQARFMFAKHPRMAAEWAEKTKSIKRLPEHVKGAEPKARVREKYNR